MDLFEVLSLLWPFFTGIVIGGAGVYIRLEVGLALTKAEINALWARRKEERSELKDLVVQLRADHSDLKADLRTEMKSLRELFIKFHTDQTGLGG